MKSFFVKLKGRGRAGSEAFLAQLSDTAISNETERVKANAQAKFQSSSFYTKAMSSVTGLASSVITLAVSTASLLGVSATLLIVVTAVLAPTVAQTPEVPVIVAELPIPVPVVPIPLPEAPVVPAESALQTQLTLDTDYQKDILKDVLEAIATDPGLKAQVTFTPVPLTFSSSISVVPEDGSIATSLSNFLATYTCP